MEEILIFAVVGLLIGLSKGGLGGPVPVALCVPLLMLIIPAHEAMGLVLPLLIFADVFALYFYWKQWDGHHLRLILLPGLIGVFYGLSALGSIDTIALQHIVGGLTLLAMAFKIVGDHPKFLTYRPQNWHGWLGGWSSGFGAALANVGAPPFAAYLLMQPKITPRSFVGTTTVFFVIINLAKLPGFIAIGILDIPKLLDIAWVFILIPIAVAAGRALITRINQQTFEWMIMIPLLLLSLSLLFFS